MISRILAALALAVGVGLLPPAPALAVGPTVTVVDNAFSPQVVRTALGGSVTWVFAESEHTSTSDQGFWDSGRKSDGQQFARAFTSSGSFGYHCRVHPHMHGMVRVPMRASGSPANGWTLRWSTTPAAANRNFDVQVRRAGTTAWTALRRDTARATATFDPSRAGTYQLRARTSNTTNGKDSGWSPVRSVTVS